MPEQQSTNQGPCTDLAAEFWRNSSEGWAEVDRLVREKPENLPALIRALASSAPDGALSYIGVTILEDIAELAQQEGRDDMSIEVLTAAQLSPADTFEILAGPYPEYLERWGVRDRFAATFTPAQLDALMDWPSRYERRLVVDGLGFRLAAQSEWFQT